MQQRRVGTLTMGVVLVILGVTLFLSQLKAQSATAFIIKGWPLVLILLGCEVLWHSYTIKGEKARLKYDIFSIFIVGVICIVSLGFYGLTEVGLISRITDMVSNQSFTMSTEFAEFPMDTTIKKLVIDAPGLQFKIRTVTDNAVTTYATAHVKADSMEKATEFLKNQEVIYHRQGDTLYVSFNRPTSGNIYISEYNVTVPSDLAVEIDDASFLRLHSEQIGADWRIYNTDRVDVEIVENADLKLVALVDHKESLQGDIDWQITEPEVSNEDSSESNKNLRGEVTFGSGRHNIHIVDGNRITVNKL